MHARRWADDLFAAEPYTRRLCRPAAACTAKLGQALPPACLQKTEAHAMNLLKSLAAVSSMTMLSRVLGFVRDTLVARIFGAGMATDAFFVAFKLPNLLRRIFAEGAFSQAFVPIFGEYRNRRGHDETKLLVDHVTTMLAIILFVVTLIGIVAAPILVYISAPGFAKDAEKFDLTVQLQI